MYSGHLAVGLALSERFPRVRPWILFLGVGFLDVVDGVLVAAGIERVSAALHEPLGFNLDFIDWDHSLLMALVWSALFALLLAREKGAALPAALAVFSHFLCDLLLHNGDLALWPGSTAHLGFYLWDRFPVGSWFIEGAFDLPLLAYFAVKAARRGVAQGDLWKAAGLVALLHVSFYPALSPMKLAARLATPAQLPLAYGALVVLGFTVPAALLGAWLAKWHPRETPRETVQPAASE